jgi:SAM-dependent methyltransferase
MSFDELALDSEQYQLGWINAYENTSSGALWKSDCIEFLPEYCARMRRLGVCNVLEAGCGDGRNTMELLQHGFQVIGTDLSPIALERTLDASKARGFKQVCLVRADIERLPDPFPRMAFEWIVCLDVFGQLSRVQQTLQGFRQLLIPQGYILMNLYTLNDATFGVGEALGPRSFLYRGTLFRFFSEQDVDDLCEGFEIVERRLVSWVDPPHPGYREASHKHESHVLLLRTKDNG